MKKILSVQACLLLVVCILLPGASAKEVTISGTVKESATSQPVPTAAVFAIAASLDMGTMPDSVDTFYTETDGTFEIVITAKDDDQILIYGAQKEGFLVRSEMQNYILTPMPEQVDAGDILLKTTDEAKDTLQIKGVVVDSVTQAPLPGASVIVTSGVVGDISVDSFSTDAQGAFEGKLPYIPGENSLFNFLFFNAAKESYDSKGDTAGIPENEIVDLGTIEMNPTNTSIALPPKKFTTLKPTHISIFSLQGKRIYCGPVKTCNLLKKQEFSNQQVIVRYFRNEKLVGTAKDMQLK